MLLSGIGNSRAFFKAKLLMKFDGSKISRIDCSDHEVITTCLGNLYQPLEKYSTEPLAAMGFGDMDRVFNS